MVEQPTNTPSSSPSFKVVIEADSPNCNLNNALISHRKSLNIEAKDLENSYYSIAAQVGRCVFTNPLSTHGLIAYGTSDGVFIFANKFPSVFIATYLTTSDTQNARYINNYNLLTVSGMLIALEAAVEIFDTWLSTLFKSPCPASNSKLWPSKIESFLYASVQKMSKIEAVVGDTCAICCLAKSREFKDNDMISGGSMKIVRKTPTSAVVRFKVGSVELAHHHTFGHDLVVLKGRKRVWNLSKNDKYDSVVGDYLFMLA